MTRRAKLWSAAALLFGLLNLGGAAFALAHWELLHAGVHVGLLLLGLLGAYIVYEVGTERQARY